MLENQLTFNDLPMVMQNLLDKVERMETMLQNIMAKQPANESKDKHIPLTVEQACEYLNMPKATFYYKVGRSEIPAIKQGKRYYIYQDELDRWLESARKTEVPLGFEEHNVAIMAGHRRKPNIKNR